ncbi:MAG: allantoinase: allantoinase [Solirubrobacterales bacterium]|nr:allantoinase: allantoinase [Solirubrobacterales bacterium]
MDYDLLIRGGLVVAPGGVRAADVAIVDGAIAGVGPQLFGSAGEELDATGLHVLPGGIDMHVHCDEPGRTEWEGFATATAALAVGGLTAFADMPLNSTPATVDVGAFDRKHAAAGRSARVDFALWAGLVPGHLDQLDPLHERGVIGFKAFMSETGVPDFRPADDDTLLEGMRRAAALGALVAVHAENTAIVTARAERAVAAGRGDARSWLDSRPPVAELEAIERALTFAADTGCRLHVVHVSTAEGVALIRQARAEGVDASWETATHFLALTEEDVVRLGPVAKCAPVPRDADNRARLWDLVATEPDAIVASDHSPCAPEMKATDDFFAAWGGVNGCQSTLGVLLDGVGEGRLGLAAASAAIAGNVAARLQLPAKGRIAAGCDADLALVDLDHAWSLTAGELRYRHRMSALVGMPMRGAVRHVLSRGRAVVRDGDVVEDVRGRLLRPAPAG